MKIMSLLVIWMLVMLGQTVITAKDDKRPHHPPELTSTKELIVQQNQIAERLGVPIITEKLFRQMKDEKPCKLVLVKNTKYYQVNQVRVTDRWTYPYVRDVMGEIGELYYKKFHKRFPIISMARTLERYQRMIKPRIGRRKNRAYNPNVFFDPDNPEAVSMHVRLLAFDSTDKDLTEQQKIVWRETLVSYVKTKNGRVQVAEESNRGTGEILANHYVVYYGSFLEEYYKNLRWPLLL